MKRLLDVDPLHGTSCWFEYDHSSKQIRLTHEQDVTPFLDLNKAAANDDDKTKRGIKGDWWKYASIPAVVEIEWMNKYGITLDNPAHRKKVFDLLNHPDYRYLKTTGKIHTVSSHD